MKCVRKLSPYYGRAQAAEGQANAPGSKLQEENRIRISKKYSPRVEKKRSTKCNH